MKKKIFYFTTYYPNRDVQWKTDELNIFVKYFNIEVIPFENRKFEHKAEKIKDVKYTSPLFDVFTKKDIKKKLLRVIFSKFIFKFISEAIQKKVFLSKTKLILWTEAAYKILMLSNNKKLKDIFKNADSNTVFYFYWGRETSEILGFLKTKAKIIVRYHGYDLYEERNNNYIPFRKKQLKTLNYAIFISENGLQYLKQKYSKIKFNTKLSRLGTKSQGISKQSSDNIFRIASCSSVIPLKRVNLIAEAVMSLNFNVEWTHIGSGDNFESLKKKTANPPQNIKINLVGQVAAKDVPLYYVNTPVDLFINVSTTEGLPVSIMEAMAAEIPVLATNVGGTRELVSNDVGKLLPPDLNFKILAEEIKQFKNKTSKQKELLRKNAFALYDKKVNFEKNTQNFVKFINKI